MAEIKHWNSAENSIWVHFWVQMRSLLRAPELLSRRRNKPLTGGILVPSHASRRTAPPLPPPQPLVYGPRRRRSEGHKVRCRLRRLPFGTDIDQPTLAPTGKLGSGSQTFGFVIVCFGLAKMKRPTDKTAPPDEKPPTARKPSRITKEILKVIEEYASTQREFLKALRKRLFH